MESNVLAKYLIYEKDISKRKFRTLLYERGYTFEEENENNFYVCKNYLWFKNNKLIKAPCPSFVLNNMFYLLDDNIYVIKIPNISKFKSKFEGNTLEYNNNTLILNDCIVKTWEFDVKTILLSRKNVYIFSDNNINIFDLELNFIKTIEKKNYFLSSSNLIVFGNLPVFITFEGNILPMNQNTENYFLENFNFEYIIGFNLSEKLFTFWFKCKETMHFIEKKYIYENNEINEISKIDYNIKFEKILEIEEISLYKKGFLIENPVFTEHTVINDTILLTVVTKDTIYMIYEDYIAGKNYKGIIYEIDLYEFKAKALESDINIFDLYLSLQIYTNIPLNLNFIAETENFIFKLFLFSKKAMKLIDKLNNFYDKKILEKMYCRVYRRIDDPGKKQMNYLMEKVQSLDNLEIIIIYFQSRLEDFIELCIKEKKEYKLLTLVKHYEGHPVREKLAKIFLKKNCFYLFCLCKPEYAKTFENYTIIEEYNMITQKNRDLSKSWSKSHKKWI